MAREQTDKLEALREKMAGIEVGGNTEFWRPDQGANTIRILPAVGEMEFFFQEVGRHYSMPGNKVMLCPRFTTGGEHRCPVCELVKGLYKGSTEDRALASKIRLSKSFWMNVMVRTGNGLEAKGPYIYTPGVSVFQGLQALINDPDYGDISDISEAGIDITIVRDGEGLNTSYQVNPRRKSTPLSEDPEEAQKWLDEAYDLSWVMLSDDPDEDAEISEGAKTILLPYDRILDEYGVGPGLDTSALMEDADEDDKPASKRSSDDEEEDEVGAQLRERRRRRR